MTILHISFTHDGEDYRAEVDYFPGRPGRYNARPEDCYPDDPPEVDLLNLEQLDADGHWMIYDSENLSPEAIDALENEAHAVYLDLQSNAIDY